MGSNFVLCVSSILRIVPETHAADRRTWNSKPSEEMRVTNGEGVPLACVAAAAVALLV